MADELVIQGKTVKMTFGRLNYVASKVGDLSEIGAIFVVPEAGNVCGGIHRVARKETFAR